MELVRAQPDHDLVRSRTHLTLRPQVLAWLCFSVSHDAPGQTQIKLSQTWGWYPSTLTTFTSSTIGVAERGQFELRRWQCDKKRNRVTSPFQAAAATTSA